MGSNDEVVFRMFRKQFIEILHLDGLTAIFWFGRSALNQFQLKSKI